jgi:hypothetical protein
MLIDAMERAYSPEFRAKPCNRSVLAKVYEQLARRTSA